AETRLVATPAAASAARRFIVETLEEWDLETAVDDAVLCGSELVTNAVLHAGGELVVRLTNSDGEVLLEVVDEMPLQLSAVQPRTTGLDNAGMTGRGLSVLATLATEWGVDRVDLEGAGEGKVVWARFPVEPMAVPRSPPFDLDDLGPPPASSSDPRQEAELVDVPARTFLESEAHLEDVLRELQVAWLSRPGDGPLGFLATRLGAFLTARTSSRATSAAVARHSLSSGNERVHLLVAVDPEVVDES